jgi:hypothetical protein
MGELMPQDATEIVLQWIRSHYFGKYRGTVSDNSDPTSRGRLKVKVPSVLGTLEVWAMPCAPYAGDGVGFYSLPEAGTGVWIEFEAGDPSYPVYSGFFWADNELPDSGGAAVKIWKTGSLTVRLDDDTPELKFDNSDDATITLGSDIEIVAEPGKVTISTDGVTLECSGQKVDVTSASVSINDGGLEVI